MMKIGIDVDGVLRNFCDGIIEVIKMDYPDYLKDGFTEITDWQLENNFNCTKKDLQEIYWYDWAHAIMGNGKPFKDNLATMRHFIDNITGTYECEWVCITSQKDHARHYTLSWLGKHELNFDRVVFAKGRDKWKVDVDYLVDDSPQNWHHWKHGRRTEDGYLLLDRPYNQNIDTKNRIFELFDIAEIIL